MKPIGEFGLGQAAALQDVLDSPERGTAMGYCESAGFLFAVCCNPDMVQPSEWLPEILGEPHGNFADLNEAQRVLNLLMEFYNHINQGVLERRPDLPRGCEPRADPLANLEDGAPLNLWARGFLGGYDWLQESWPDVLPGEIDKELGACIVVLTFFSSRRLAETYWNELKGGDLPFDTIATEMLDMLPLTMATYADLGRSLYEATLELQSRPRTRKGGGKKTRKKRRRARK